MKKFERFTKIEWNYYKSCSEKDYLIDYESLLYHDQKEKQTYSKCS